MTPGFATAKGAQRMLTQSLARDLGPKGVHCFYVIVDGSIGNDSGVTGTNESRKVHLEKFKIKIMQRELQNNSLKENTILRIHQSEATDFC